MSDSCGGRKPLKTLHIESTIDKEKMLAGFKFSTRKFEKRWLN